MPKKNKLTPKQQRFVEEYLIDLNATQAEITAEYVIEKLKREINLEGDGSPSSARVRAVELLGKHLGMFRDKVEVTGKDGEPFGKEQMIDMTGVDKNALRQVARGLTTAIAGAKATA